MNKYIVGNSFRSYHRQPTKRKRDWAEISGRAGFLVFWLLVIWVLASQ